MLVLVGFDVALTLVMEVMVVLVCCLWCRFIFVGICCKGGVNVGMLVVDVEFVGSVA